MKKINLKSITFTLLVLLLFTPITGQLVSLPIGGFNLLPSDVVLPILLLIWFVDKWKNDRKIHLGLIGKSILVLIGAMILSYLFNLIRFDLGEMLPAGAHLARIVMYMLSFFVAYDLLTRDKNQKTLHWILVGLIGAMTVILILGLLQFFIFPSLVFTEFHEAGWDPHIKRLFSTWLDPNFIGGYATFILGMVIALVLYFFNQKNWKWFGITSSIALMGLIAVGLTFSRSGYLALVTMLGLLALIKSRKLLLVGIVAGLLIFVASPRVQERVGDGVESMQALFGFGEAELDPTAALRVESWNNAWEIIADYPVLGAAYNRYPNEIQERGLNTTDHAIGGSDSSLLTLWATTGLLGLLAGIGVMVTSIVVGFKAFWRKKDLQSYLSAGILAGLAGLMVSAVFVNALFYALIMIGVWVGMALLDNVNEDFNPKN